MHILYDRELIFLLFFKVLPLKQHEISVAVVAAQNSGKLPAPLVELILNRVADVVFYSVGLVFAHLIEVVNDNDAGDRPRLFILDADIVIFRDIHPVGNTHESVAVLFAFRADEVSVQLIFSAAYLKQGGVAGLALKQPFPGKLRHDVGNAHVDAGVRRSAHIKEHLVAPNDARVVEPEHRNRQREIHQRTALCVFRLVGDGLNILSQLLFSALFRDKSEYNQNQHCGALCRRKLVHSEKQRCRRECRKD